MNIEIPPGRKLPPKAIEIINELLYRKKIKSSLAEYARMMGYEPAKHHLLIIEYLEKIARDELDLLLIFAPPGSAKALTLDTPIPTPTGWSTMGELKVGDQVFDENGKICNVIRKSEIFKNRPIYEILTDCGDKIYADEDHQWWLLRRSNSNKFKLETSKEIAEKHAAGDRRAMITKSKCLDLPHVDLPIDPYLLGVWLGDGHSSSPRITQSKEDEPWLKAELRRLGYACSETTPFTVLGIRDQFVKLGLLDDKWHGQFGHKHIPPIYLRASKEQREALLQGLIDTDGCVSDAKKGGVVFTNTNKDIAYGVAELVRSLGAKASIRTKQGKLYGKLCKMGYIVSFYYENAARMPRKKKNCRNQYRTPNTYVEAKYHGVADTVCIEVDSPSHLFLAGESMTPTHNSTYVSLLFPSWYLSNFPRHNYLAATHNGEFAARWGRKVRNDLLNPEVSARLEITVSPDSQAADRWTLTTGGEYYGVGAGAGISGFRADIAAIDDPFGSREDAYSPQVRSKRWDWYLDDFSARMKPSAKRIVMATRWHEDDISGKILQQIEAQKKDPDAIDFNLRYKVLSIPAISESLDDPLGRPPGTYLWDDPEDRAPGGWNYGRYLRNRQKETSPMMWSALYQQRPAPESGDFFKEEWIKPLAKPITPNEAKSRELAIYGASDYAVSADGGDFTVHIVVGVDHDNNMYLLDVWRGQSSPDVWIEQFCTLVKKWEPREWGEESGQIKSAVGPFLSKRQMETEAYVFRRSFPTKADKAVRAQSIRGRMAVQGLYIYKEAVYYEPFRVELLSFPAGKHDDHIDALGLIGQMLDHIVPGEAPPAEPSKPRFIQDITLDELFENQPSQVKFGQRI